MFGTLRARYASTLLTRLAAFFSWVKAAQQIRAVGMPVRKYPLTCLQKEMPLPGAHKWFQTEHVFDKRPKRSSGWIFQKH
jgi:hypothetical protein